MITKQKKNMFKLIYALIIFLFIFIILETGAYFVMFVKHSNFYLPLGLNKKTYNKIKDFIALQYDYDLGWEYNPATDHFYRGDKQDEKKAVISLFGDSYTFGYEEDVHQSWPFFLAEISRLPVLNFGLGGYGTDQAYLRFEKRYVGKINTPYAALGVMSENISRIMNRYRGFLERKDNYQLTKPMFKKMEDGTIT